MHSHPLSRSIALGVLVLGACFAIDAAMASDGATSAEDLEFFETRIRPVLVEHCYACHSSEADELQAGLLLDTRAGLLQGGDSGPAVVPGNPEESLLLGALDYDLYEMPPSGKLPDEVIADFRRWVAIGMPDPRDGTVRAPRAALDVAEGREFWAFQPITPHDPPQLAVSAEEPTRVDAFLQARLQEAGLTPAPEAARATWLRRVTFDLIGLPPSPRQIDDFVADDSPRAYERVIDRLLASPHFGERWGRHWLDIARFAESSGGGRTLVFNDAWRYRDYVIESFNRDKPLDLFIIEQIAGDVLPHATPAEEYDHLVATGYLMLGAHNYEQQDKRLLEMDVVDEQLDTIGRGLLGMTLACARCHDHKFDPIPTTDYYALAGVLRSTKTLVHANVSRWNTRDVPLLMEADEEAVEHYRAAVADLESRLARAKEQPTGPKVEKTIATLEKRLAAMRKQGPPVPSAMAAEEADAVEDCRVCIRGSVHHRGSVVPRGVLQVAMLGQPPTMPRDESGRRELAEWIASPQNPLTARVYVNRVWHYLFGAGLVRTLDNFGTTGERPSHPELLDDLAWRFMQNGWSTKQLIRELVLTRAYRMSTAPSERGLEVDPENRLLWRMNRRRLDAESIRDAMLVVSGRLDTRFGGPNILDPAALSKQRSDMPTEYTYEFVDTRRSVYTPAFRNRVHELFEVFDFANYNSAVARRSVTTVAPQALFMLNSPFVMDEARYAAERMLAIADLDDAERVERAFREALGRAPTSAESAIALQALKTGAKDDRSARLDAWQRLMQGLFACVDFRYLD